MIQTTEKFVGDLASGKASDSVCTDSVSNLGVPSDWSGLSAGEPEKFFADYWEEQAKLNPQWNINLEGLPDGAVPGTRFPGDIFFRETEGGLCIIDVAWSTLESVG